MSLIKCHECGAEISDKALRCPQCGYPLNQSESEQKKNEVIEKGRKRGKTFLISGGIIFLISMFLGLGTVDMELGLRVKKIYHGLYGFEMVKWLFLRYVPDLLLWISLIILIIGIVLMIVYRRKKPE